MRFSIRAGARVGILLAMLSVSTAKKILAQPDSTDSAAVSTAVSVLSSPPSYANYPSYACAFIPAHEALAGEATDLLTWHDRWPSTAATRQRDSAQHTARRIVTAEHTRACLSKFSLQQMPPLQVLGMGLAWLAIEDTAHARAVFAKVIRHQASAPVRDRAWLLHNLVVAYANGPRAHLSYALQHLRRLDALGSEAAPYQLLAHNALYNVARGLDDLLLMELQANAAVAVCQRITSDVLRERLGACAEAEVNRSDVDIRNGRYATAVGRLQKALVALGPLGFSAQQMLGDALSVAQSYGSQAPAIKAHYVFWPGNINPDTNIKRPAKGRVSVLMSVWKTADLRFENFERIERLVDVYGDQIDITLVTTLRGYDFDTGRFIPEDPEAAVYRDFFHVFMKVKAPVVVYAPRTVGKMADGRVIRERDPNIYFQNSVLIDKKGAIRSIDSKWPERDIHMIAELLREPLSESP